MAETTAILYYGTVMLHADEHPDIFPSGDVDTASIEAWLGEVGSAQNTTVTLFPLKEGFGVAVANFYWQTSPDDDAIMFIDSRVIPRPTSLDIAAAQSFCFENNLTSRPEFAWRLATVDI